MNKPEHLPHPDFSHWLPASLRDHADGQKAIPRIVSEARELDFAAGSNAHLASFCRHAVG